MISTCLAFYVGWLSILLSRKELMMREVNVLNTKLLLSMMAFLESNYLTRY
jgi:hypothetical protein